MFCNHCFKIIQNEDLIDHLELLNFDRKCFLSLNQDETLSQVIEKIKQKNCEIETKKQNCNTLGALQTCLRFMDHLQGVISSAKTDLEQKRSEILKSGAANSSIISVEDPNQLKLKSKDPKFLENSIAKMKENEKTVEELEKSKELLGNGFLETIEPNFMFQNFSSGEEFSKTIQSILSKIEKLLKTSSPPVTISPVIPASTQNTQNNNQIPKNVPSESTSSNTTQKQELPKEESVTMKPKEESVTMKPRILDSNLETLLSKINQIEISPQMSPQDPSFSSTPLKLNETNKNLEQNKEKELPKIQTPKRNGRASLFTIESPNIIRLPLSVSNPSPSVSNASKIVVSVVDTKKEAIQQPTKNEENPQQKPNPTETVAGGALGSRKRKRDQPHKFQDLEEKKKSKKQKIDKISPSESEKSPENASQAPVKAEKDPKTSLIPQKNASSSSEVKKDTELLFFPKGEEDLKFPEARKEEFEFAVSPYDRIALKTVPEPEKPLKLYVACTCWFGLIVESSKRLIYAFGDNNYNQISNSSGISCLKSKFVVPGEFSQEKVKSVGCGSYHMLILFENQGLFGQGWYEDGRFIIFFTFFSQKLFKPASFFAFFTQEFQFLPKTLSRSLNHPKKKVNPQEKRKILHLQATRVLKTAKIL